MMLTQKQQNLVDEVMDNFDFHRVAKVMKALDWKWADRHDGKMGVPTEQAIKAMARDLMLEAIEKSVEEYDRNGITIGTGGFEVYYNDKNEWLSLKFVLTDWSAYTEE